MKALQLKASSTSVEGVALVELDKPEAGPGEVLVNIKAVSLNFRDLGIIAGQYFGGPVAKDTVLCSDGAGEVVAVGDGVSRFKVGDKVAGTFFEGVNDGVANPFVNPALGHSAEGALSEFRVFQEDNLVHIPANLNFEEGSCLPCAGVTAWHAIMEAGKPVSEGDTVLLLGTGGVSIFGLQFAKAAGAKTIVTSSSDEKLQKAKAMGSDMGVNYKDHPDWEEEVKTLTNGQGVNCVVEVGGVGTISKSMMCLGLGGKIGMIGVLAGPNGECNPRNLMMTGSSIHGIFVGSRQMFESMNATIEANDIHPLIDKVFEMDEALDAIKYFQSQAHMGKVVIRVS
ncbi:MAG: NAD(P)-dependent alcohol dehydrogenase [Gammaproteobacteria bacterium]|jgi:NADPH:quinone reductase-like Zn-dependent oxidoreductase